MMTFDGIVDIGCNLTNKAWRDDLSAVLSRAKSAGVGGLVSIGVSVDLSETGTRIAQTHREGPRIVSTAGIHPHNAKSFDARSIDRLRAIAKHPEVVAIGECGLDFDRDFSPRDVQASCFEAQLELAAELRLPAYFHERSASDRFVEILARYRPKLVGGVVHCFTGTERELRRYLDLDLHIGLTGWICDERRGTHLRPIVKSIPASRLMIETDAPYILPRDLPKSAVPVERRKRAVPPPAHPENDRETPWRIARGARRVVDGDRAGLLPPLTAQSDMRCAHVGLDWPEIPRRS